MSKKPTSFREKLEFTRTLGVRVIDLSNMVKELMDDLLVMLTAPRAREATFRRSYVRAVFALVEGGLSAISAYVTEGESLTGWPVSEKDRAVMWDAVANPTTSRPEDVSRARFLDRTKTVLKVGGAIFSEGPVADFSGKGYQAFSRAVKVRDRLMHPKQQADLVVSDEDLRDMDLARDWFRAGVKKFFELAAEELQVRTAQMRASMRR